MGFVVDGCTLPTTAQLVSPARGRRAGVPLRRRGGGAGHGRRLGEARQDAPCAFPCAPFPLRALPLARPSLACPSLCPPFATRPGASRAGRRPHLRRSSRAAPQGGGGDSDMLRRFVHWCADRDIILIIILNIPRYYTSYEARYYTKYEWVIISEYGPCGPLFSCQARGTASWRGARAGSIPARIRTRISRCARLFVTPPPAARRHARGTLLPSLTAHMSSRLRAALEVPTRRLLSLSPSLFSLSLSLSLSIYLSIYLSVCVHAPAGPE
jgi:hypothetical protein